MVHERRDEHRRRSRVRGRRPLVDEESHDAVGGDAERAGRVARRGRETRQRERRRQIAAQGGVDGSHAERSQPDQEMNARSPHRHVEGGGPADVHPLHLLEDDGHRLVPSHPDDARPPPHPKTAGEPGPQQPAEQGHRAQPPHAHGRRWERRHAADGTQTGAVEIEQARVRVEVEQGQLRRRPGRVMREWTREMEDSPDRTSVPLDPHVGVLVDIHETSSPSGLASRTARR